MRTATSNDFQEATAIISTTTTYNVHCVSKKFTLFIFVITQPNFDPFLIIFCSIKTEKICKQMTSFFLIIFSFCVNITE